MLKLAIFVAIEVMVMQWMQLCTAHQCGVCLVNGASCESENEYFLCIGGKKLGPLHCEADEVCTDSARICEKRNEIGDNVKNICGVENGVCQTCAKDQQFTCVSATQAVRCQKGKLDPSIIMDCDANEICASEVESNFDTVCVPNCVADFLQINASCTNDIYTPPTQDTPTTLGPTEMQNICLAAAKGKTSRFFFAYADSTCRTYVYCEKKALSSTTFETTFSGSCSSSTKIYFNTASGSCQSAKPDNCRTDAPTSSLI